MLEIGSAWAPHNGDDGDDSDDGTDGEDSDESDDTDTGASAFRPMFTYKTSIIRNYPKSHVQLVRKCSKIARHARE